MAVNVEYTLRETLINLRRNVLMTFASVLTVAVTLSLVGAALLLRAAVNNATQQWKGGIEFAVYLNPDVSEQQSQAIETELAQNPQIGEVKYVSQAEAYEEFQAMFRNSPEFVETIQPEVLPPSFRVVPRDTDDPEAIQLLGERFRDRPGVYDVVFAKDTADAIVSLSNGLRNGILVTSIALLVASTLVILNTIRLAIYARRREIEVMKLVGATNWFIRVPFMLEGVVHGVVGAGVAFGLMAVVRVVMEAAVRDFQLFASLAVESSAVVGAGIFVLVVGAFIGALGSGTAVSRFLDV